MNLQNKCKRQFRISNKFDIPCVYSEGTYYFLDKVKEVEFRGYPRIELQVVYKHGKWYQDTHRIKPELYIQLVKYAE